MAGYVIQTPDGFYGAVSLGELRTDLELRQAYTWREGEQAEALLYCERAEAEYGETWKVREYRYEGQGPVLGDVVEGVE
jgi:hypothetical protein